MSICPHISSPESFSGFHLNFVWVNLCEAQIKVYQILQKDILFT